MRDKPAGDFDSEQHGAVGPLMNGEVAIDANNASGRPSYASTNRNA